MTDGVRLTVNGSQLSVTSEAKFTEQIRQLNSSLVSSTKTKNVSRFLLTVLHFALIGGTGSRYDE